MRRAIYRTVLVALCLAGLSAPAWAVSIGYSGELRDPDTTNPIADGTYSFEFEVFSQEFGGTPIYSEQIADVPVTNGYFKVTLAFNPTGLSLETDYYLEITVNDETLAPRQLITAVPFVLGVGGGGGGGGGGGDPIGESLGGLSCTEGQFPVLGSNGWECGQIGAGAGMSVAQADGTTQVGLTESCEPYEVLHWIAGSWQCRHAAVPLKNPFSGDLIGGIDVTDGYIVHLPACSEGSVLQRVMDNGLLTWECVSLASGNGVVPEQQGGVQVGTTVSGDYEIGLSTSACSSSSNLMTYHSTFGWRCRTPNSVNLVDKSTAQTIEGVKTFANGIIMKPSGAQWNLTRNSDTGGFTFNASNCDAESEVGRMAFLNNGGTSGGTQRTHFCWCSKWGSGYTWRCIW